MKASRFAGKLTMDDPGNPRMIYNESSSDHEACLEAISGKDGAAKKEEDSYEL